MTCDADIPALVWPPKDPDDPDTHYVSFESFLARRWEPNTYFAAGVAIRPTIGDGYQYSSSGGYSAARAPRFSSTVVDGSITWTRAAISTDSLRTTISGTPSWTADAGITVSLPSISGQVAQALIADGVDSNDYRVLVQATFADGTEKTATCILPVRRPVRVCEA